MFHSLYGCQKMKRIDVIIAHDWLVDINRIMREYGTGGITFYTIKGRGRSKLEHVSVGRGMKRYTPEFQTRIKCEILVPDRMAEPIVEELSKVINAGSMSDGKIFVCEVVAAFDIKTGRTGDVVL